MRNFIIALTVFVSAFALADSVSAQRRLVDQVKQDVNKMSLSVGNYKDAVAKIAPALTHDETKDDPEAWFVAGQVNFMLYDRCVKALSVGQSVDEAMMYGALVNGFDNMQQAMRLDSIVERDKKGNPKLDKNGRPKVKTKFSKKAAEMVNDHYDNYRLAGNVFYVKQKNYENAYRAWQVYTSLPTMGWQKREKYEVADTVIGKYCYMKGVAAKMAGDNQRAIDSFKQAVELGYDDKEVFDFAISCAEAIGNEELLVDVVKEAYLHYGKDDPKYITFFINYSINKKRWDDATVVIDMAIAEYPDNAEYYDLKGVLVENQTGDIANAYEYFSKCLELDPGHVRGNYDMGRYYYNVALKAEKAPGATRSEITEKYAAAMPYLEKAYAADPSNTAARDALKNIYYNLGDGEKLDQLERL